MSAQAQLLPQKTQADDTDGLPPREMLGRPVRSSKLATQSEAKARRGVPASDSRDMKSATAR